MSFCFLKWLLTELAQVRLKYTNIKQDKDHQYSWFIMIPEEWVLIESHFIYSNMSDMFYY